MVTIQEASQQVQQARQKLAEERAKAEETRENLKRAREKLPNRKSARALRQNQFSGLAGRDKRRQVQRIEENISGELSNVKKYEEGLTKYEQEQIIPVEKKIREVQEYNSILDKLKKAQSKGMLWAHAQYGEGLEREIAQKMLKQENLSKQKLRSDIKDFQLANPTEKLVVDWKNLRITGVQSGALGETLPIKQYNKKIREFSSSVTVTAPETTSMTSNVLADSSVGRYTTMPTSEGGISKLTNLRIEGQPSRVASVLSAPAWLEKASVGFASTVFEGVKNIPNAVSDISSGIKKASKYNLDLVGSKNTLIPNDIRNVPVAIPEFSRTDTGKLTVSPSTLGTQANVLFKEYPKMLGKESSKGYRQAFSDLGIPERRIIYDDFGRAVKIGYTVAGRFVQASEQIPTLTQYIVPIYGELAFANAIRNLGERATPSQLDAEARKLANESYKNYIGGDLSKSEYLEQVIPQIREQLKRNITKEALLTGALVFGGAAVGATARGTTRFFRHNVIEGSVRGGQFIRLRPTIQQVTKGEKTFSFFKQMDVKTTKTALTQSKFGSLFRLEPKIKVIERGQTYIGQPVQNILKRPVLLDEPYLYQYGRVGKKGDIVNQNFFLVSQEGKAVGRESIGLLSPTERLPFESLAEYNLGFPVRKNVGAYFDSASKLYTDSSRVLDIRKIGTGKSLSYGISATKVRPIKVSESGEFGSFGFQTATKIFTRKPTRIGKVNIQEGILIRYPSIKEGGTSITSFRGRGGKSKPFESSEQSLQDGASIVLPNIKLRKSSQKPIIKDVKGDSIIELKLEETPQKTGVVSIAEINREKEITLNIESPRIIDSIKSNVLMDTSIKQINILKSPVKGKQKNILQNIVVPKENQMEKLRTKQTEILKTNQKQRQDLIEGISQISTKTNQNIKTPTKTPTKIPTKVPIPKLPKSFKDLAKKSEEDLFEAFVKKAGKEVSIGKTRTKQEAEILLGKKLRKTLSASGGIKFGETKLKASEINLGMDFGKSKRNKFLVVEKKEKRLRRGGTGKDIQFFRKKSSNSKSKNLLGI